MRRIICVAIVLWPAVTLGQEKCSAPNVSFKWSGPSTVFMKTDAQFKAGATPRIGILVEGSQPIPVDTSVLSYEPGTTRPETETFSVHLGDAPILASEGRVTVRFEGLQGCSKPVNVVNVVALEKHHLAVDGGVSVGLDTNNVLRSHSEFALTASSRWTSAFTGLADLRLTTLDPVKQPSDQGPPQSPANNTNTILESGGRTVEASAKMLYNFRVGWLLGFIPVPLPVVEEASRSVSVVGGVGIRTATSLKDSREVTDARWNYRVGFRAQVLGYNAGLPAEGFADTRGHLELGVARDQFWKDDDMWRLYAEQQIEIPYIGSRWLRFLARMKLDRPWSGYGPSEIRFSLLASLSPTVFGELLGVSADATPK